MYGFTDGTTPGHRIQRFEVLAHLGSGGMGTVVRARDPNLERDVAIKVIAGSPASAELSPETTLDLRGGRASTHDDLLREARMMARLSHPNVLSVYEAGLSEGAVFLVMEHIDGTDLATWLAVPRTRDEILDVFAQAGRGLAAAHERGIVHRDFKPANVLVGREGRARVADFGLSQLGARGSGMVRVEDGFGTPRYMAPELWRDGVATTKSDVFAFAVALVEALGCDDSGTREQLAARGVSLELRDTVMAALAEDPAARPEMVHLLAALAPERKRPQLGRGIAVLAGAAAAGIALALALYGGDDTAAITCEADPTLLAGRFDDARATEVRRALATLPDATAIAVDRVLVRLGDKRSGIERETIASCVAARDGAITDMQARMRSACLQRRAFELGATAARLIAAPGTMRRAGDRAQAVPAASECSETTDAPLTADRGTVAALYERYVAADELAVPDKAAQHTAELVAIEQRARELGEAELAARAQYGVAIEMRFQDKLAEADATLQDVYRRALAIRVSALATDTLVERSQIAMLRGNGSEERSLAMLALDLTDKPGASPRARARAALAMGSAEFDGGDYKAAIARLQSGLDIVAQSGLRLAATEANLRFRLILALSNLEGRGPATVKIARETVDAVKELYGEHDANYGTALNLLALAHRTNRDLAAAVPVRERALAILEATLPAHHSSVILERSDYAADLYALGKLEPARREMAKAVAATEHNQKVRGNRADLLQMYAFTTWDTGRHAQALDIAERALEESTAQYGVDHPMTLGARTELAAFDIELGRTDAAARQIAAVELAYRTKPDGNQIRLARLEVLRGDLENARGQSRAAEPLARHALAVLDELHGADADRWNMYATLGVSLVGQRRWTDARAALDTSYALARATQQRADVIAAIEIEIARVELGQGRRADAVARATRARSVLDTFRGQLQARKHADAILARARR